MCGISIKENYRMLNSKKITITVLVLILSTFIQAQNLQVLNSQNYIRYDNYENSVDYFLIFNGIDQNTEISFEPSVGHDFKWFKYDSNGLSSEISNQNFINPENNTGYVVEIDGVKKWIWVIDYLQYQIVINSLVIESLSNPCSELNLRYDDSTIPALNYISRNGVKKNSIRNLNLKYTTLSWSGTEWLDKEISLDLNSAVTNWGNIENPLKDTYFTLTGDQFASELGLAGVSVQSELYQAVKLDLIIGHLTTVRKEKNEANNPSDSTVLTGSAPLEIEFVANVSSVNYNVVNWTILSEGMKIYSQSGDAFRYTFDKAGSFYVKAEVSNDNCTASDSVLVKVDESAIYAPNVFTPNGDGINDEFRVAYKSIVSFRCDVFNRWGKKVFSWTNPQKGWDGTVNGVPANPGPYFYVIQAIGSEGKKYELKGDINLLRGKTK